MGILNKIFSLSKGNSNGLTNQESEVEELMDFIDSGNIDSVILELDCHIGKISANGDDLSKLTEQQKHFLFNQNIECEILDGGFYQYFYNPSGDFAHETVHSLLAIGAKTTADILHKAIGIFQNGRVPKDRTLRRSYLDSIENNSVWKQLDQEFIECDENLNCLNMNYIKSNRTAFKP